MLDVGVSTSVSVSDVAVVADGLPCFVTVIVNVYAGATATWIDAVALIDAVVLSETVTVIVFIVGEPPATRLAAVAGVSDEAAIEHVAPVHTADPPKLQLYVTVLLYETPANRLTVWLDRNTTGAVTIGADVRNSVTMGTTVLETVTVSVLDTPRYVNVTVYTPAAKLVGTVALVWLVALRVHEAPDDVVQPQEYDGDEIG